MPLAVIDGNNVPQNLKATDDAGELVPHHVVDGTVAVAASMKQLATYKESAPSDKIIQVLFDGPAVIRRVIVWNDTPAALAYLHIFDLNVNPHPTDSELFTIPVADARVIDLNGLSVTIATGIAFCWDSSPDNAQGSNSAVAMGVIIEYDLV